MKDSIASTSEEVLINHRQHFPALAQNKQYFNYGGQGPMAQPSLDALFQAHHHIQTVGPFSGGMNGWIQQEAAHTRNLMAQELATHADTLTLTEDVTVGCNIPLWGMSWCKGDHILMSDCEHPGVIAAVQEICRRYELSYSLCPLMETVNGGDPVGVIEQHLRPETRLLVISHIFWNTGQVLPLREICQLCHGHTPAPVWVLVDAAQSVGALPLDLPSLEVDFYAFTGHKWWCGPAGLGGLYIRPEALEVIQPTFIGWRGITTDGQAQPTGWKPNGQRFEVATSNYPLLAGLRTAIAYQHQGGSPEQRYQRICQLAQLSWQKLAAIPYIRMVRQTPPDSGLISFWVLEEDHPSPRLHKALVDALEDQGVFLRTLLSPNCVRACVHYLTLESEVIQLAQTIQATLEKLLVRG